MPSTWDPERADAEVSSFRLINQARAPGTYRAWKQRSGTGGGLGLRDDRRRRPRCVGGWGGSLIIPPTIDPGQAEQTLGPIPCDWTTAWDDRARKCKAFPTADRNAMLSS
ncbi:hypothetical protein GCM10010149_67570 [Nonomuraea roseoviolacea subsp. roseoviolacea]